MRVLFTVSDYVSHYLPMVPLAWALQAAGHQVRIACPPSQAGAISGAGLTPVLLDSGPSAITLARFAYYLRAVRGTDPELGLPLHPVTGLPLHDRGELDMRSFARRAHAYRTALDKTIDDTVQLARVWQPDLVIHDLLSPQGVLAAKVAEVPAICHLWGPVSTHETDPDLVLTPPDTSSSFPRYGLPEWSIDLVDYVIDPCPKQLAGPTRLRRLPVRFLPYNGPGAAQQWLLKAPERPRVCLVWGDSVTAIFGQKTFLVPHIMTALADLNIELVVTCSRSVAETLSPPANTTVLNNFPVRHLTPSCSAVIHHGGAGSGMTAAWAGAPQLTLPYLPEQHANARAFHRAGVALSIPGPRSSLQAIREAVTTLIEDTSYRESALSLRDEIAAAPTPAQLVRELEHLAA
ncbi:nucleotide disphospho-sugar-binding domain-containing protein [Amycolatopsis sp. NPDC004378]